MVFAHDTEVALGAAATLVNTLGAGATDSPDTLTTLGALDDLVRDLGWTGSRTHDRVELDAVRALRPRLREVWEAAATHADARVAALVNAFLAQAQALPQLVTHDDLGWHVHATSAQAPLADRMAVEAAMAFIDVVRGDELDRLRTCAADDCDQVLVDLSRNRSRRFCDAGCGNRENVRAYRHRLATGSDR